MASPRVLLALGCTGCPYVFGPPDLDGVGPDEDELGVELRGSRIGVAALSLDVRLTPAEVAPDAALGWSVDGVPGEGLVPDVLGPLDEDGSGVLQVPWIAACDGPTEVSVELTDDAGRTASDVLSVDPSRVQAASAGPDAVPVPAVICGSTQGGGDPVLVEPSALQVRIELTNPRGNLDVTVLDAAGQPVGLADGDDDPLVLEIAAPELFTVDVQRSAGPQSAWTLTIDRAP